MFMRVAIFLRTTILMRVAIGVSQKKKELAMRIKVRSAGLRLCALNPNLKILKLELILRLICDILILG